MMKQWRMDITPKCENGCELFVTSRGTVRPCFWISEASDEKNLFDNNDNWNLDKTSMNEIVDVHLKKFVADVKRNPFNGLKVCFYECTEKYQD